jgi:predicted phosphodiesterase
VTARIAVIADVHGNAPALAAVLAEAEREGAELLVSCGDLTWGPLPRETLALLDPWRGRARFVRGNADRALGEDDGDRAEWLRGLHGPDAVAFVTGFEPSVVVEHDLLGAIRFTHGSPRSDEECVTVRTPEARVREFLAGVHERVVFTAHTHVQYDRVVDGTRLVNAGSVGMPYEGRPGAYWALVSDDVHHRRTEYDVGRAVELYRASGDPRTVQMIEMLLSPPEAEEVIEHAESVVFAG